MLKTLRIENFQKVKGPLEIEFDSVTAIVGESNIGKSCAFRGLESLILNSKGNKFITKGASSCKVYAETDLGWVEWLKKKTGSATYTVEYEGKVEVFKKAEGLPDVAKKVLGIGEIMFGDQKMLINLQGQFEPPFLLFESGSTVAKVLGKFTKLDEIYAAIRVANKDLLNVKQELGVREKDKEEAEIRLKKHGGLNKLENVLGVMERMAQDLQAKEVHKNSLEEATSELDRIRANVASMGDISGVIGVVGGWPEDSLMEKIKRVEEGQKHISEVNSVRGRASQVFADINNLKTNHNQAVQQLQAFKTQHQMCPTCERPLDV